MPEFDVDFFVIGAGSGGVRAARIAATYGARVMLAEEWRVGGTCVLRGCVPKKLYAYASRFRDEFEDAAGFGWTVLPPRFDWASLVANKEAEITRLSAAYRTGVERVGGSIVEERAEIAGPHQVRLTPSGRTLTASHILIATGARPVLKPAVPGLEHAITSDQIFDVEPFPRRLLIVGGGYIAVEFASVFVRLGAEVTQVTRAANVLRGFDEDMREACRDALAGAGVRFSFGVLPSRIEKHAHGLQVSLADGRELVVDQVLIATGRKPNTAGLGLERAGVKIDAEGAVKVDPYSVSTVPSIYAVGDVTNRLNLTPVAVREGHALADTLFGGKTIAVDHKDVPSAVFTTPEIGTVGLTEAMAREFYPAVDIYRTSFRPMRATLSGRAERTIMKLVVDGTSDRMLGVHIFGHEAGELAQVLAIAIKMKATKADFDATMALHPTAAEELVTMRRKV